MDKARHLAGFVFLVVASGFFLFPYYWLATSAFKSRGEIFEVPPVVLPIPPHWKNFQETFSQFNILGALLNSTLIAALTVALTLTASAMAGYAFSAFPRARGSKQLYMFVLSSMFIPFAITMIPSFIVLTKLGLINTYWAMVLPGATSAFGVFWMRQYIAANIPASLIEAARIDGCPELKIFFQIVAPLCKPALTALGIVSLIGSWNNLMWAFVVLRSEEMYTMPLLIYLLHGEIRTPYGVIMAGGLLITLPLIIAFIFFQRAFIRGLTAGSIR